MKKTDYPVPTIFNVRGIRARGPWKTKSSGKLNVLFAMPLAEVRDRFLHYRDTEISKIPNDICGLRAYTVNDLSKGKIGGTEWHRIREEIVFTINGLVQWTCVDLFGARRDFIVSVGNGIWIPPFILHTYEVLEKNSRLLVIANTLFDPDDHRTHDTYSPKKFRELMAK
ncbi:MAG: WxcM-like domain-containing protein [Candidatus Harrisonbacteria bacterium]|nr:WxcM-like domain-containing protein [Candidatus Harrisonbacteria bacterium]